MTKLNFMRERDLSSFVQMVHDISKSELQNFLKNRSISEMEGEL